MFRLFRIYFFSFLLRILLNCIFYTCKIYPLNQKSLLACVNKSPILLSVWHQQGLLLARYFKQSGLPVWAVSSTHPDSEILAKVLSSWNIQLIRGSSTRGWINVTKQIIKLYSHKNSIVALTPDGPRGPKKQAKKGSFLIATKYSAKIFSVSARPSSFWRLPSWDQTYLPKPFSTIYVRFEKFPDFSGALSSSMINETMNANQENLLRDINEIN